MSDTQPNEPKLPVQPVIPLTCGKPAYVLPQGYHSSEYGVVTNLNIGVSQPNEQLIEKAKSIYESWNWDMLEAEIESGYDRGSFRSLVDMYLKMVDHIESLHTELSAKDKVLEDFANGDPYATKHKARSILSQYKGDPT